jgi:hypothetical protein
VYASAFAKQRELPQPDTFVSRWTFPDISGHFWDFSGLFWDICGQILDTFVAKK